MMSKRKCSFNDVLQRQYSCLEKRSEHNVFCTVCLSTFSIASGGKHHITTHMNSAKHKKAAISSSTQSSMKGFLSSNCSEHSLKIALAEGVFTYHNVKHAQTFREMDCLSKVLKKVLDPAYSCARTKSEAIVESVFAPWAMEELRLDLQKSSFVSVSCDASNHGNIKVFPLLLRYFNPDKGVSVKLLELKSLNGENSDLISSYILDVLKAEDLTKKLIGFCADNTNMNFGGCSRNGTNNVHTKLKEDLEQNIVGIGCAAHIINNTLQTAVDCLPVDIETVLVKIYSHFHIYTVRVEELKDFCNYVAVEYQQVLGYCKTRWLSLLPALERLIAMFIPLKTFFLSQKLCPVSLKKFFSDQNAEYWLRFVQIQAAIFNDAVMQVEGQNITALQASVILNDLLKKYENRLEDKFLPLDLQKFMNDKEKLNSVLEFYSNCIVYLKKWILPFQMFKSFSWMSLKAIPAWNKVHASLTYLSDLPQLKIDDSKLYDDYVHIKSLIDDEKIKEWNIENVGMQERWIEIFSHFNKNGIMCENIMKLVEFIMSLPGTNAPVERVFSAMNRIWTSEKNKLKISTLRAMLVVKTNFNLTCVEFYDKLKADKKILEKVKKSEKYSHVGERRC